MSSSLLEAPHPVFTGTTLLGTFVFMLVLTPEQPQVGDAFRHGQGNHPGSVVGKVWVKLGEETLLGETDGCGDVGEIVLHEDGGLEVLEPLEVVAVPSLPLGEAGTRVEIKPPVRIPQCVLSNTTVGGNGP